METYYCQGVCVRHSSLSPLREVGGALPWHFPIHDNTDLSVIELCCVLVWYRLRRGFSQCCFDLCLARPVRRWVAVIGMPADVPDDFIQRDVMAVKVFPAAAVVVGAAERLAAVGVLIVHQDAEAADGDMVRVHIGDGEIVNPLTRSGSLHRRRNVGRGPARRAQTGTGAQVVGLGPAAALVTPAPVWGGVRDGSDFAAGIGDRDTNVGLLAAAADQPGDLTRGGLAGGRMRRAHPVADIDVIDGDALPTGRQYRSPR